MNFSSFLPRYHHLEFSCDGTGGTVTSVLLLSLPLMLCVSLRYSLSTSQRVSWKKNDCLTPRDGVVRVDGLIFTALCTCQELLIGALGNVPGTSRAKRKSCHSLNERCHLGNVSNYALFVETITDLCRRVCIANTPALVGIIDIFRDYVKMAWDDYSSNSSSLV